MVTVKALIGVQLMRSCDLGWEMWEDPTEAENFESSESQKFISPLSRCTPPQHA